MELSVQIPRQIDTDRNSNLCKIQNIIGWIQEPVGLKLSGNGSILSQAKVWVTCFLFFQSQRCATLCNPANNSVYGKEGMKVR